MTAATKSSILWMLIVFVAIPGLAVTHQAVFPPELTLPTPECANPEDKDVWVDAWHNRCADALSSKKDCADDALQEYRQAACDW